MDIITTANIVFPQFQQRYLIFDGNYNKRKNGFNENLFNAWAIEQLKCTVKLLLPLIIISKLVWIFRYEVIDVDDGRLNYEIIEFIIIVERHL